MPLWSRGRQPAAALQPPIKVISYFILIYLHIYILFVVILLSWRLSWYHLIFKKFLTYNLSSKIHVTSPLPAGSFGVCDPCNSHENKPQIETSGKTMEFYSAWTSSFAFTPNDAGSPVCSTRGEKLLNSKKSILKVFLRSAKKSWREQTTFPEVDQPSAALLQLPVLWQLRRS